MRTPILIAGSVCCVFLSAQPASLRVDLARIGQIAPKGRVQDKYYNPDLPVVAKLIEAGPKSIPFLISKLEDKTPVKGHVMDFWPDVRVGDVAWIILCDFFTTADWEHSTISPGLGSIIEDQKLPSQDAWAAQLRKDGRAGIRKKVEKILSPYQGRLFWDAKERCFRVRD